MFAHNHPSHSHADETWRTPRWEHFHHAADIGIRGYGASMEAAFEQVANALTGVISDLAQINPGETIQIQCEAPDAELLLVDWLNALIYEMAVRNMLFSRFNVHIAGSILRATAEGERINRERHQPAVEVKGATYTELRVCRQNDGSWLAQCVIDV